MHSRDLQAWLNRLELEHANLRALLEWSLAENQTEAARLEKGARVVGALYWFWHYRGYWSEGLKWAETTLSHPLAATLSPLVRAKALYTASWMNIGQGNLAKANILLEESFEIYQQHQDKWGITHAMDAMAELARQQGNYAKAGPLYQAGLELCNELDDQFCANYQLIGLGYVNYQQGEYQKAHRLLQDGLASSLQLDDHYGAARAFNGLGELLRREGEYRQARDYYEQSLAMYRELGHTGNVVMVLHNLGQVELDLENFEKSSAYFKSSLILAYEINSKRWVSWCFTGLAGVRVGQGEYEQAARLFGAAEILVETSGAKLDPINQTAYEQKLAVLRTSLEETKLVRAWQMGRNLSVEQAITLVLNQSVVGVKAVSY
jgi:tetratricopeptide (TPR) repeat protein